MFERGRKGNSGEGKENKVKEGLFRIVYGRKGGWHRVLGGGKDAGSSTSNLGAGSDEVGAAEEQGGKQDIQEREQGKEEMWITRAGQARHAEARA